MWASAHPAGSRAGRSGSGPGPRVLESVPKVAAPEVAVSVLDSVRVPGNPAEQTNYRQPVAVLAGSTGWYRRPAPGEPTPVAVTHNPDLSPGRSRTRRRSRSTRSTQRSCTPRHQGILHVRHGHGVAAARERGP